ncbi:MAG: EamA family transporter [Chloroflexota bacterium]
MTYDVFFAVLGAALLHAAWNALVKVSADRLVVLAIMMAGQAVFALLALPFVEIPPAAAWPNIAMSTVLHTGYFLLLISAYRFGDLSHVYPLARGVAPLIVALVATFVAGEVLGTQATVAVLLIALGIMSLMLARGVEGFREPRAVACALATGLFIAGYTIVDGLGARQAGSAHSYILWLNVFNGMPTIVLALVMRRGQVRQQVRKVWKIGALSGVVSLLAYWIALWAMTQAPLAFVSAVRETGMVFAVLFGVFFLKERLDLARLASTFVTLLGTVLLK